MNKFVSAVIVAAGNSSRMGNGISKQFIELNGEPVILHTVKAFQKSNMVDEIIVVCLEKDISKVQNLLNKNGITKLSKVVKGSSTRQKSAEFGVKEVNSECTHIAIHDGARALILPGEIDKVVKDAFVHNASTAAVPVKDTIKIVNGDLFIDETPDRNTLYAVQTPQVFEKGIYLKALQKANSDGKDYTDDCQLVENIGLQVHICIGDYNNIKITTPEDINVALNIIKTRKDDNS